MREGRAIRARLTGASFAAAFFALVPAALGSTYRPNRTGDHAPNGCNHSDCTLREAVIKANAHPGGDRIVLRGGKVYDLQIAEGPLYDATDGDLDVLDGVTIKSSSRKLATVDANSLDSVFEVKAAATFRRLKIRGGDAIEYGGGINAGDGGFLKVVDSVVTHNHADIDGGGIHANCGGGGKLVVSGSKIASNDASYSGGGVSAQAASNTITNTTIANNIASIHPDGQGGGGIFEGPTNSPSLTVKSSTISGNRSGGPDDAAGGGFLNQGVGVKAKFVNVTFTKNKATGDGGGVATEQGASTSFNAVTVARNEADRDGDSVGDGGGIEEKDGSLITIDHSLIAKNTLGGSGLGPDCRNGDFGGLSSGGHNLIGDGTSCVGLVGSDFVGLSSAKIGIRSLADNGGPTKTIALKRSSKAINHAGFDAPGRDQRGVKRHYPDIGAYERR